MAADNRVTVRLSPEVLAYLDQFAEMGIHGKTRADVARTFIQNEVERLVIREKALDLRPKPK